MAARLAAIAVAAPMTAKVVPGVVGLGAAPLGTGEPRGTAVAASTSCLVRSFCWLLTADACWLSVSYLLAKEASCAGTNVK